MDNSFPDVASAGPGRSQDSRISQFFADATIERVVVVTGDELTCAVTYFAQTLERIPRIARGARGLELGRICLLREIARSVVLIVDNASATRSGR